MTHEYSVFKYEGDSAEEFVALLLYKDFDRHATAPKVDESKKEIVAAAPKEGDGEQAAAAALPAAAVEAEVCKPGLLDESASGIGISNKPHDKCTNSIQILVLCSTMNQMV